MSNKYKEEYCDDIIAYFSSEDDRFPTFEGFASSIGVLLETIERWTTAYPRFKESYEKSKQIQKEKLISKALNRTYDASIARLLMSSFFAIREKTEVESTVRASVEASVDEKTLAMIERVSKRLENGKKD